MTTTLIQLAAAARGQKSLTPKQKRRICFCDDDDEGHFHCTVCDLPCHSLTLAAQNQHVCVTDDYNDICDMVPIITEPVRVTPPINIMFGDLDYPKWLEERKTCKEEVTPIAPKRVKTAKPQKQSVTYNTKNLINFVANAMRKKAEGSLEFIDTGKSVTMDVVRLEDGTVHLKARVAHLTGKRKKRDLDLNETLRTEVECVARKFAWKKRYHTDNIKPGMSGLVLNSERVDGDKGRSHKTFIVRGKINNCLIDATSKVGWAIVDKMIHYSEAGLQFWRGFDNAFRKYRRKSETHECTSNLVVEECGSVMALITLMFFPCGKITCNQCVKEFVNLTRDELHTRIRSELDRLQPIAIDEYPTFHHVHRILDEQKRMLGTTNSNKQAFDDTFRIVGARTDAPFSHIQRLNEILVKGALASPEEFSEASNLLRELARFQKNRTENIKKGSLVSFRNKISAKTHINASLMCDNQLDPNGNFLWGKREYHAKRVFANYFEKIDPSDGYDKHIVRSNPNGIRRLAIGNLLLTTNLSKLRERMEGEYQEQPTLTNKCVAMLESNFVYPCSCVTLDDGTPVKSRVIIPTKNHLVIGNTGDPKYVDLPAGDTSELYIAKPGFCYMNVFLAMLVNVNENEAKDFTKLVRDTIQPKLQQWPSVIDLATACYFLAVMFPDTLNAELPRILVDHVSRTMHVVDSYGSLTTGYHILKASTVSQFIQFATEDVKTEMKHYTVGGIVTHEERIESSVSTLIKCIFKPRLMKHLLEEEPYLIVFSLISPAVLKAMYDSGSFEMAIDLYTRTNMHVAHLASVLSILASKVSVSRTLLQQKEIIDKHLSAIHENLVSGVRLQHSYSAAINLVHSMRRQLELDTQLSENGFTSGSFVLMHYSEKKYREALEESWRELTLCEKYSSIKYARRISGSRIPHSMDQDAEDIRGTKGKLFAYFSDKVLLPMKRKCSLGKKFVSAKINDGCFKMACAALNGLKRALPELTQGLHVLVVVSLFIRVIAQMQSMIHAHQAAKQASMKYESEKNINNVLALYNQYLCDKQEKPTVEEFQAFVDSKSIELGNVLRNIMQNNNVSFEAKPTEIVQMEKIIAVTALIMMIFNAERSDCVHRVLQKFSSVMTTLHAPVHFQSLDDMRTVLEDKKLTIDFEVEQDSMVTGKRVDMTFEEWWNNQLVRNNTIPHYRNEGHFMEFTRKTAADVANQIAHSDHRDILLRGMVGSGKSTGLPHLLSKKGNVLLVEPTRPLAENVSRQLRGSPFYASPTLQMRGLSVFGSSPITVMTSGYALHYLANNVTKIPTYDFIIFDECHVQDASAMALRCLLAEYDYPGRIIKASATPPGREVEFDTMFPVSVLVEDTLSLQNFVLAQGSKSNCDVTNKGDNILVYVASYNEVDTLSKLLLEKGYKVTKVDGRTMKLGGVSIETKGSPVKKHFIVATNIIENGVTLDIDVVVDFGVKVIPIVDIDNRTMRYSKVSISYGERIQRLGRVGRNKPGTALRIGHTEKGLVEINTAIAMEAAFMCFTYSLPVMTHNVTTALLSKCTTRQARTMAQFELPIFYMYNLVHHDGTMHKEVFNLVKPFRLRESEVLLNKFAIPNRDLSTWLTQAQYERLGCRIDMEETYKAPFYAKDIPDKLHSSMWEVILKHRHEANFTTLTTDSAQTVAYTLSTDVHSIPRTIRILDSLLESEREKQAYFDTQMSMTCSQTSYSLASIVNAIRSRYKTNYALENIGKIQAAKAQILEFQSLNHDPNAVELVQKYGALNCVHFQTEPDMINALSLKGVWNASLITRDVFVIGGVVVGGAWMLWTYFQTKFLEPVHFHGNTKRARQKMKFKNSAFSQGMVVSNDDDTFTRNTFGAAYTEKGKNSGETRGMGRKNRRFTNMYGFDPTDFSFIRFVDPLTGETIDENVMADIHKIQEEFGNIRSQAIADDVLEPQAIMSKPGIKAYFVKNGGSKALEVDLTPHEPLRVSENVIGIAGFPERKSELRQTAHPTYVDIEKVPNAKQNVAFESKSLCKGVRNYNPIANSICRLTMDDAIHPTRNYGICFGSYIITNRHLMRGRNGTVLVESQHGTFLVKNATQLAIKACKDRDIIVIRMPKDFVPFPQKLKFRSAVNESVCMVGTIFQDKQNTSTVSETSTILPVPGSSFWKHWIETKVGDCGYPLVSVNDGCIVGIHSLGHNSMNQNFLSSFPSNFMQEYLTDDGDWTKHWNFNINDISWGTLNITEKQPDGLFRPIKRVQPLRGDEIHFQAQPLDWVYEKLECNLKAVARCSNQLVTKHVVNGKCPLFETYLAVNPEANNFFQPLLGAYQKSGLNKEAYVKDLLKYSTPISIGNVQCDAFEIAIDKVERLMRSAGFETCSYVTDHQAIIRSLNKKAAVGTLYSGKKKDYLEQFTEYEQDQLVLDSCYRLYSGLHGIWNGSLKAELRSFEKVEANKTRTFTAAPIDILLAGKVCVDDFNNQFYDMNIKLPWTVGMTKFYGGWDELYNKLPDGWLYCDADGSQFDSSLSPYLINAVLELRMRFMEKWEIGQQMLRNLYTEIVYTPIATPDGTIVKKFKGNNSGQPSTVVDNSLMVVIAMYYSLQQLGYDLEKMNEYCVFFVNGDDLIIAVKPDHERILDHLQNHFSDLGLKYTFADRHMNKSELWFMSHKGIKVNDMYIPKLEQERIVSILEWDRAKEPWHRLEALCAAMIESWGYPELTHEIRKFYAWVLEQAPYNALASEGYAPYISEVALKKLYTNKTVEQDDLKVYVDALHAAFNEEATEVHFQGDDTVDAGRAEEERRRKQEEKERKKREDESANQQVSQPSASTPPERDVNVGTKGKFVVPRFKSITPKMKLPKVGGKVVLNLDHLLEYQPEQVDLFNTRSTQAQFKAWYDGVKNDYDVDDEKMGILLNGLMVWCIENGTSPNISGTWVMMDGEEQIEYPIKPLLDHASPTLRQIMAHFSNAAEAYIEMRNSKQYYMPRYGLQRNLTDRSLARYAFDFYEVTPKMPNRAREAHMQMKAAALQNVKNKMFGLDGNVSTSEEDTERHVASDASKEMHNLLGVRM